MCEYLHLQTSIWDAPSSTLDVEGTLTNPADILSCIRSDGLRSARCEGVVISGQDRKEARDALRQWVEGCLQVGGSDRLFQDDVTFTM
jgi:hypothetical protein